MLYTYTYPKSARSEKQSFERIYVQEDWLDQTHTELINRLDSPGNTVGISTEIDAPFDVVWQEAAGSVGVFFSHMPDYRCLVHLNSLGTDEGGRYVVIRESGEHRLDRIGEVLIHLPNSQLTVSDIDSADPSVSGTFPSLFTVRLEPGSEDADMTTIYIGYTMLGVPRPDVLNALVYQINSIFDKVSHRLGRV